MTQPRSYEGRARSMRNYEEESVIGRGAYGTVFKARDIENDRIVALKRVRVLNTSDERGVPISTLREITLLKQLDNLSHPNIVRMYDAFQTYSTSPTDSPTDLILTIVFEHVEQDLSQFLHNFPPPGLPEHLIKCLMYQLFSGIDYLHVNRLVHRDIKPQNILITKNKQLKIADFGLARVYDFNKLVTSVVVTLWYRAPEILLQQPYATLVDLWSIGTIMVEMYNRRPLFPGKSDVDELHKVLSTIGCPPFDEWPDNSTLSWETFKKYKPINFQHIVPEMCSEGLDMLKNLLVYSPDKRLNAHACLNHSYFNDIEKQDFTNTTSNKKQKSKILNSPSSTISQTTSVTSSSSGTKRSFTDMIAEENTDVLRNTENMDLQSFENQNVHVIEKSDSGLDDELSRSDSGLSDISSLPTDSQHSFDRIDSGICVSPTPVTDNDNSSNSEQSIEEKLDKCEEKPFSELISQRRKSEFSGYDKKTRDQSSTSRPSTYDGNKKHDVVDLT